MEVSPTREVCARCRRPTSVCYCAALPRLETRTRVVILQHPREREHPIGTARMATLCLPQAKIHVGVDWSANAALERVLADPARRPVLLYPGPATKDILREPPAEPVTLVVIDGTWSQTRRVIRDNPRLRALPTYAFEAPEPSEYRIRREPRTEYVSTIEALMHVLGVLEGDPARFRALLAPFRTMVDLHLARRAVAPDNRTRVPKTPRPLTARLPREIATRWEDLVCVVGEANAWPYHSNERGLSDELVHWVAQRVATGETFDVVAAPQKALSPTATMHTRLDEARLRSGGTRAALFASFDAFLRADDVLCAWGTYPFRLFEANQGTLPSDRIDVRSAAQRLTHRKVGALEDYAPAAAGTAAGRAGDRLARLAAVLERWRRMFG